MDNIKNKIDPRVVTEDGFKIFCSYDALVDVDTLIENPRNPNKHPDAQIEMLAKIIKTNGWRTPITVSKRSGFIVRGHARRLAAYKAKSKFVPIEFQEYESEAAEFADLIADNRIAELASLNNDDLRDILKDMDENDYDLSLAGFSDDALEALFDSTDIDNTQNKIQAVEELRTPLKISPFSILDTRLKEWLDRKRYWKDIGIKSEIGRGCDGDKSQMGLTYSYSTQPVIVYKKKEEYEKKIGCKIPWAEFAKLFPDDIAMQNTSIFDPVLCELIYNWYCPANGTVLDPFAGGSVRGIVAAMTKRNYTGVDISSRQIDANYENWKQINEDKVISITDEVKQHKPNWIVGDSNKLENVLQNDSKYDLLFSCPPYANLEVYSDDPADISNKDYPEFLKLYRSIINKACQKLMTDSFAVFVVGEVRGKDGGYYNFVSDTIKAFIDAGLSYYSEAVLINSIGSASMRINSFTVSRKLIKIHQNVLVFAKGNSKKASERLGEVYVRNDE